MSHICMAAWKIPRAFCPHPGPPKLTNQFDHVGEIWFSHDWSHSEIPHPLPRSLLIHGGFCMETPDIATKEFHSKGLGVGKKKHGMFKTKSFKRAKHYVEIYIPAMMWWDVSFLETVSRRCQGVSFQLCQCGRSILSLGLFIKEWYCRWKEGRMIDLSSIDLSRDVDPK